MAERKLVISFSMVQICWAIVTAIAMLTLSYSLVILFGFNDLPWFFEHDSNATIRVSLLSLFIVVICMFFHPE
ncbi:hypothetical protein B0D95_18430 [Cellvibrio sp. PSBB023]|jgi:hypothetical protein|nr:hypothetical protein B0D95_18430 [Cellvibrio sp. PSBB023]